MSIGAEKASQASFKDAASASLSRLRTAFGEMVAALPGDVRTAASLHKALAVDPKLGWQVFKIANSPDPLAVGAHVPARSAFSRLLKAVSHQGVPESVLESMSSAYEEFEQFVKTHAGDRQSLEMMIAGCVDQKITHVEMAHRKAAFRANSYLYGLQARAQLKATFFDEAGEAGMCDAVVVRGFVRLRRIRACKSWVIARARLRHDDGTVRHPAWEPLEGGLDAVEAGQQAPVLKDFCSTPTPDIRRVATPDGFLVDTLLEGPIGNRGAIDVMTGEVIRNVSPRYRDERNDCIKRISSVQTPCEVLIFDQFIREGLWGPLDPELLVYAEHIGQMGPFGADGGGRTRVPVHESVQYLGKGPDVIHTTDVPRYPEMARYVFDRMGWDGEHFDVFRIRIAFPFVPTAVVFHQDLPDPPES